MLIRSVLILTLTLLTGCVAAHSHPPQYVQPAIPRFKPAYRPAPVTVYREDPYVIREMYQSRRSFGPLTRTQMRLHMNRHRVMHGSGCYVDWCPRGGW